MSTTTKTTSLAPLLERFFTQRLMQQRQVSPHTISSYRGTFRLLLTFAQERLHIQAAWLALAHVQGFADRFQLTDFRKCLFLLGFMEPTLYGRRKV